jgi:hypothetical protein
MKEKVEHQLATSKERHNYTVQKPAAQIEAAVALERDAM